VPGNFLSLSPDGKFLVFQNIAEANSKLQAAILSTENPDNVSFVEIPSWRQTIRWSVDDNSLDFVTGNVKQTGIMRQTIEGEVKMTDILPLTQTTIFNFAWSPNGENLALSRGQLLRDVVLLSNFE
jgi:Tol biopolymer transport system component